MAPTDPPGIYPPMTRGHLANHAYVVVDGNQTAVDVLTQSLSRDWIDHPALTHTQQLEADSHAVPVWSSVQTARLGRIQQPAARGARQYPGPAEPGHVEQPEHDQRVWQRLTEIQNRPAHQRTAEQTTDRDAPGLER